MVKIDISITTGAVETYPVGSRIRNHRGITLDVIKADGGRRLLSVSYHPGLPSGFKFWDHIDILKEYGYVRFHWSTD